MVFSGYEPRTGVRWNAGVYNAFDWQYELPVSSELSQTTIAEKLRISQTTVSRLLETARSPAPGGVRFLDDTPRFLGGPQREKDLEHLRPTSAPLNDLRKLAGVSSSVLRDVVVVGADGATDESVDPKSRFAAACALFAWWR